MKSEPIPTDRNVGCAGWQLRAKTVGGISSEDLGNKNCLKNQPLTPLWDLSLFQWKEQWVVPDYNYARKQVMEDRVRIWSVDKNCPNKKQLKLLWSLSLFQLTEQWVMPDDNSDQKQGVGYRASIWSINNKCLNNQQLTPLWSLSLVQRTELWVVPDDNFARKQVVEYRAIIWWIRTVSTIRNWHLSELWAYLN